MGTGTEPGTEDDPPGEPLPRFRSPLSPAYNRPATPVYRPPRVGPPAPPDRPAAERPPAPRPAPAGGRRRDRMLLDLLAVAAGVGALVSPWAWLVAVTAGVAAAVTARSLADHEPSWRALGRRAGRRAGSWLRPRSLVTLPVLAARTLLVAVAVSGAVAGGRWLATEGRAGAVAAARAGAWAHGLRVAAVVACALLVSGVGEARTRRAAGLRRAATRLGPGPTMALAAAAVAVVAGTAAAAPRLDAGWPAGGDGLAWVPGPLRDDVDRVRDDLVTTELDAAASCLGARQDIAWRVAYTGGNAPGAPDVARLAAPARPADPGAVATAAVAAHNQLAPWVERLDVAAGGRVVVSLDRTALATSPPAGDPTDLAPAARRGRAALRSGGFDRRLALRCSAGPVP
jgi:hypothetical protein